MPEFFPTVGLLAWHHHSTVQDTLRAVKDCLDGYKRKVLIEEKTSVLLSDPSIIRMPGLQLAKACDLLIVVGGDGSLLHAARIAVPNGTPVLGINRGSLGFLTDICPRELGEKLGEVLKGSYQEELRCLLRAQVLLEDRVIAEDFALNEVVLMPGDFMSLMEFSIAIDGQFVCVQRADGLIVATPTGSTAYALSGGGPILHPKLDALVLVPMFPHTLTARPIVISSDSVITIRMRLDNQSKPCLRFDGRIRIPVSLNGEICVNKQVQLLRLIHPMDYNFFSTLQKKLHWQKTFHNNAVTG